MQGESPVSHNQRYSTTLKIKSVTVSPKSRSTDFFFPRTNCPKYLTVQKSLQQRHQWRDSDGTTQSLRNPVYFGTAANKTKEWASEKGGGKESHSLSWPFHFAHSNSTYNIELTRHQFLFVRTNISEHKENPLTWHKTWKNKFKFHALIYHKEKSGWGGGEYFFLAKVFHLQSYN